MRVVSDYLEELYNPDQLLSLVERTVKQVRAIQSKNHFDALAFTGISGAGVAFPLSMMSGIPLIAVRKDDDDTHHSSKLEGVVEANTYAILDDFIDGGNTVRRIMARIAEKNPSARCVAIILWATTREKEFDGIPVFPLMGMAGDKYLQLDLDFPQK